MRFKTRYDASSAAISARSTSMPALLSDDVAISSGCAAGRLAIDGAGLIDDGLELFGEQLVGLGEDDLVAHRVAVELGHDGEIVGLGPVTCIDQHIEQYVTGT